MIDHSSSPKPAVEAQINVDVEVFRIAENPGTASNTSSGRYLFIFSQDVVHVDATKIDTRISYRLTSDTVARGFSFIDAYTTDPKFQLTGPYLESSDTSMASKQLKLFDTISFVHSNTHASLISVSLQVEDHRAAPEARRVAYDPQITNKPGSG